MNISADKPWSITMKVALASLSLMGALIVVGSIYVAIQTWKADGAVEREDIIRLLLGGMWTGLTIGLLKHPEWKQYLAEKF